MLSAVYRSTELRINPLAENNLNQAVDHYLQYIEVVRGYSAHTVKNYRRDLSKLIEFCSEHAIDDITRLNQSLLRQWVAALSRENSRQRRFSGIYHRRDHCINSWRVRARISTIQRQASKRQEHREHCQKVLSPIKSINCSTTTAKPR